MSSSVHVDNKGKDILILDKEPRHRSDGTMLTTEAKYPISSTQSRKRFVFNIHYNGSNSFLFVSAIKLYQFKAKNSKIKAYSWCLGNVSKDFTINNMEKKKKGLKGVDFFYYYSF